MALHQPEAWASPATQGPFLRTDEAQLLDLFALSFEAKLDSLADAFHQPVQRPGLLVTTPQGRHGGHVVVLHRPAAYANWFSTSMPWRMTSSGAA